MLAPPLALSVCARKTLLVTVIDVRESVWVWSGLKQALVGHPTFGWLASWSRREVDDSRGYCSSRGVPSKLDETGFVDWTEVFDHVMPCSAVPWSAVRRWNCAQGSRGKEIDRIEL